MIRSNRSNNPVPTLDREPQPDDMTTIACRRIICGILMQSIYDACLTPAKEYKTNRPLCRLESADALRFIDDDKRMDFWCSYLHLDPGAFRRALDRVAYSGNELLASWIKPDMRRAYRVNRELLARGDIVEERMPTRLEWEREQLGVF